MAPRRPVRSLFVTAGLLLLPLVAHGQGTGRISGTVTTADRHDAVVGACISLDQRGCAAVSDARGKFLIRAVPAGNATLTVTAIGRKPGTQSVTVTDGQTATADFALEAGPQLLSPMVVTATRVPTEANRVATTVNVLTPQHIGTSPARESQDLLREIPGVELPRTSSLVGGTAQIVSIRGVDEGRTAVLYDGIPINDAWGEWIDWGRVPKGTLDRVEVVEGGTSNLYGNGAIGGVISFFSRPMAPGSVVATVDGGSRDAKHGFLAAGLPIAGALTATITGDLQDGGGYVMTDPDKAGAVDVASEITQRNATMRLNYTPTGRWTAFLTGHLFGDTRHLGTPLGLATRNQRNLDFGLTSGTLQTGSFNLRGWFGTQDENQRATAVRANSSTCATPSTAARQCEDSSSTAFIPSRDYGLSAIWQRGGLFGLESFSVGGDFRHMNGEYDEVDFNTSCPGSNCGKVTRAIQSGGDQNLGGVFVQAIAAPAAPIRIELGGRFDRWENNNGHSNDPIAGDTTYANRSKNAFSPRIGIRGKVSETFSLHGAFYKAFRAPNLAELYRKQINASASQITIPNPDLKPEYGTGWEGGLDWQPIPAVELKGTYYIADYKDFNVPTQIAAGPPVIRQRLNISKARSKGGEVYLAVRPLEPLALSASANYDNDRVVSNDATNGNRVNRVPSPKYNFRASWTSSSIGTWTAIVRYEGHTTTLQGTDLQPFTVVDANVQRELAAGLLGFLSVENVGNTRYEVNISGSGASAIRTLGLPRTLRAGLTWTR